MKKHGGREYRVREIAYLLWERDGYPDGASDRHWFEAELLYDAEDAERKAVEGEPPGDAAEKKAASAPPKDQGSCASEKAGSCRRSCAAVGQAGRRQAHYCKARGKDQGSRQARRYFDGVRLRQGAGRAEAEGLSVKPAG